jgi:hypothetical protein
MWEIGAYPRGEDMIGDHIAVSSAVSILTR